MANDITTIDQTRDLATRWSEPCFTPRLTALLADKGIWTGGGVVPALDGDDRACAEAALARYAVHPQGSSEAAIGRLLGTLATAYPAAKLSDAEAEARRRVYVAGLRDIDIDQLRRAVGAVVRISRFFPSVAEIREAASALPAPERQWRMSQLRRLLFAKPAATLANPVGAGEVAALLDTLRPGVPDALARTDRLPSSAADRSQPSLDDYRALGLAEEEALEQWSAGVEQERKRREAAERARTAEPTPSERKAA